MAARCKVGQLISRSTAVFLCDLQEKFRPNIQYFKEIVEVSSRILKCAKILDLPVYVTEQYPKGKQLSLKLPMLVQCSIV